MNRLPEPTWWSRHRKRMAFGTVALCLGGLVTSIVLRPGTLGAVAVVAVVAMVFALRFASAHRLDDGQEGARWFPRE